MVDMRQSSDYSVSNEGQPMICCPLSGSDDGEYVQGHAVKLRTARKEHKCYECGEVIMPDSKYEYASGVFDGSGFSHKTCMSCREIRDHFSCAGFIYGQLWEDLENNFFPDMKAGGPCMEGLSPEAKGRLFDERLRWLMSSGK